MKSTKKINTKQKRTKSDLLQLGRAMQSSYLSSNLPAHFFNRKANKMSKTFDDITAEIEFQAGAIGLALELEMQGFNPYAVKALAWDLPEKTRPKLVAFWQECSDLTRRAAYSLNFYAPTKKTLKQKIFAYLKQIGIEKPLDLILKSIEALFLAFGVLAVCALIVTAP